MLLLRMKRKIIFSLEYCMANFTNESCTKNMKYLSVFCQNTVVTKTFVTLVAFEFSETLMNLFDMLGNISLLFENLSAKFTRVG